MAGQLRFNRVGSAILAVGTVAFSIGVTSGILEAWSNPFLLISSINVIAMLIYPTVVLLLCVGAVLTRSAFLRIIFILAAFIAVPLLLKRDGGEITDVSEAVKIRSAQYFYAAATLRDVATILWIACATSALCWLPKHDRA